MAVTEGYVQGPADSVGKKVDTTTVTQTDGGTVHREGAVIADPEDLNQRANVKGEQDRHALGTRDEQLAVLVNIDHSLQEILTLLTLLAGDSNS